MATAHHPPHVMGHRQLDLDIHRTYGRLNTPSLRFQWITRALERIKARRDARLKANTNGTIVSQRNSHAGTSPVVVSLGPCASATVGGSDANTKGRSVGDTGHNGTKDAPRSKVIKGSFKLPPPRAGVRGSGVVGRGGKSSQEVPRGEHAVETGSNPKKVSVLNGIRVERESLKTESKRASEVNNTSHMTNPAGPTGSILAPASDELFAEAQFL